MRLRKTVTPTAKVYISALDCLGLAHLVCRCAFYKKGTSSQLAHVLSTSYMSSQDVMMKYRCFYTFPDDSLTPSKLQQPMACPLPQLDNVSSEAVRCFPFCAARSLPLARTSHSIKYAGIASAKFYSKDCHSQEPFEKVSPPANWGWPCLAIKAALTWFGCEIWSTLALFCQDKVSLVAQMFWPCSTSSTLWPNLSCALDNLPLARAACVCLLHMQPGAAYDKAKLHRAWIV